MRLPTHFVSSKLCAFFATLTLSGLTGHAAIDLARIDAAHALYNARKNSEAQAAYQAIIAEDPANAGAHHHLGYIALRSDDPDMAVMHFKKAVELEPTQLEEALQTSPNDFVLHYRIGQLAKTSPQQIDRGLTALRRCLELPPVNQTGELSYAAVHGRIGNLLQHQGDIASYEASLAADPGFIPAAEALKKLNKGNNRAGSYRNQNLPSTLR